MKNLHNSPVIAERRFYGQSRDKHAVRVSLTQPVPAGDERNFVCRYIVETTQETFRREAWGVDTFQALLLALKMLTADLESTRDEDFSGILTWEFARSPGDLGLPND